MIEVTSDNFIRDPPIECVLVFITQQHLTMRNAIVIDNFGAGLTPSQIRDRMQEYDLMACNLCIPIVLLTTHRTVIDNMKGKEECLFVFKSGCEGNSQGPDKWIQIEEVYLPDWLAHFALGDIYDRVEIE